MNKFFHMLLPFRFCCAAIVILSLLCPPSVGEEIHHVIRYLKPDQIIGTDVNAMAFSPDNQTLAVALGDGRLSLVDYRQGRQLGEVGGRQRFVVLDAKDAMNFSRDGNRLYMIGSSGRKLLDMQVGLPLDTDPKIPSGIFGVHFVQRDGKIVVDRIWSGGPAEKSGEIAIGDELTGVGAGTSGTIQKVVGYNLNRVIQLLKGRPGEYGRLRLVSPRQLQARIVTLQRAAFKQVGEVTQFLPLDTTPPQDNVVWCISDDCHAFYDARTGVEVSALRTQDIDNRSGWHAISPDSQRYVFLGRMIDAKDFAIEIFDIGSRERTHLFPNIRSQNPPTFVAIPAFFGMHFSPDGKLLLIGTWDTVIALDSHTGKHVKTIVVSERRTVQAKKRWTLGGSDDGDAVDEEEGDLMSQLSPSETKADPLGSREGHSSHQRMVDEFSLSSQGILAVGDFQANMRLFDFETGDYLATLQKGDADEDEIEEVRFSPDGKWLAYYNDSNLHLVDVSAYRKQMP